jgi:hypothetical protein
MTEFNALINDNFKKLPYDDKARIAGNFFDAELSNDNFKALPEEEQTRIKSNFLSSTRSRDCPCQSRNTRARPDLYGFCKLVVKPFGTGKS